MADPLSTVAPRLAAAFAAATGRDPDGIDPVVRPSDRADAQSNGALALAKQVGRNPRELATEVAAALATDEAIESAEVAGPGFINLRFRTDFLAREVAAIASDERLGVQRASTPRKVVIDYSHPNVAKEMHVGHLRTTIIGDSLARLLGSVGHTVVRQNHIGDWGRPFGMLIEHLLDLGETEAAHELSVGDLNGFYREAGRKFEADDEFKERARARVVMLQSGDPETLRLWELLVAESTRYFNSVYRRLGVLLTDDDLRGESAYNDLLPVVVRRLDDAGLLQRSEGAEVVFPPGYVNRDGEPLPVIVRNSVGGYNYATTDLACVIDRVERVGADLLVYVVGAPQALHLEMVWKVCEMAGWLHPPVEVVHVPFGSVLGADKKMFKSRVGETVKLSDLLDEAVARARGAIDERESDLSDDQRAAVAETIGIGAVKYADLSTDRVKDYVFDWDRMLSFDGNTAPYLQYAHARICSLFRRAGVERESVRGVMARLDEPPERALGLRLLQFDSAVADTIGRYAPHRLCTYLFDLAQDFTAFYEHCPVLRAADEPTRASRLALSDLTARVLAAGLDLLGIRAPERM